MFGGKATRGCGKGLLVAVLIWSALPAWAEDQKEKPATKTEEVKEPQQEQRRVQKVFQLKHVDPAALASALQVFPVRMQPDRKLSVLSVSGTPDVVAAIEEAIKRFDVPPRASSIELTVHLLATQEQPSSEAIPAPLQGVVSQLRGIFSYKSYRLMETQMMRTRDGEGGNVSGILPTSTSVPTMYSLSFRSAQVSGDERDRHVRLDDLKLSVKVPISATRTGDPVTAFSYQDVGMNTDIDVREGQKVVVGKATVGGAGDALILVVTAKIVD